MLPAKMIVVHAVVKTDRSEEVLQNQTFGGGESSAGMAVLGYPKRDRRGEGVDPEFTSPMVPGTRIQRQAPNQ